jgi:D-aminoacyl-tRNA deacylase
VKPLILVSRADSASLTIRDALLDAGGWEDAGSFHGLPVRRRGDAFLMAEVEPLHIECELVDVSLQKAGFAFDAMLVASRHRAESGKPALTVHPIGNYGEAEYGGMPRRLSPAAPVLMSRILRRLQVEANGLKHAVTFEATHHGPLTRTPTCFVEIGTDEAAWTDPGLGKRVARAMLACVEPQQGDEAPVLVGLGGSHYAPKFGDLVKQRKANFGHLIPGYQIERGLAHDVVLEAIRATPGCQGYYLDPRSLTKPPDVALETFGALELGWFTDAELAGGGDEAVRR